MNVQSMSICVPAMKCYNNCTYCCSKMHGGDYENIYGQLDKFDDYAKALRNALEFARDNGCNTVILTGNNEPQQDTNFLKIFALVNQTLTKPFRNIEMQTSGALVDDKMLYFLKHTVGITTMAVSTSCIDDPAINLSMVRSCDKKLNLGKLYTKIKSYGFNLRVCLNMNDQIIASGNTISEKVDNIFNICTEKKADQITFRKLWSSDETGAEEKKWIDENVTSITDDLIDEMKKRVKEAGKHLGVLEFGASQYDYMGFSIVIDEDSMAQDSNKQAIKYLIFRPDGHLYSRWDSKASRLF